MFETIATYFFGIFFFFQAEDGIRDLTVTGVQTCALPIWPVSLSSATRAGLQPGACSLQSAALACLLFVLLGAAPAWAETRYARSEERRVGKECRSRWSTENSIKKNNTSRQAVPQHMIHII